MNIKNLKEMTKEKLAPISDTRREEIINGKKNSYYTRESEFHLQNNK